MKFSFSDSKVSVRFEKKNNATMVILSQFGIFVDDKNKLQIRYECSSGWTLWLVNLKAFIEHGILLNETEINLQESDLSGYEFANMQL